MIVHHRACRQCKINVKVSPKRIIFSKFAHNCDLSYLSTTAIRERNDKDWQDEV